MKTGIKVVDAMTRLPISVAPGTTLQDCAHLMKEKKVGSLLVKEGDSLVGILTERDVVRKAVASGLDAAKTPAKDVMVEEVITTPPNADIFEAIHLMKDHDIRHLPVADGKKLVGFITIKDILKIQPQLFENLVDKMRIAEEERKMVQVGKPREGICQTCGNFDEDLKLVNGQQMCEVCREDAK
ncbi:CBS domain-containing protein [Candidatus Woesearchaeota archaeon]|nr:CBS domain-containing protein [Candidatus Woesearchaeota archaeon]